MAAAGTATLAEIARQAGVSAPTVSKVLNGRAHVAPATRNKVEELLRHYGYRRKRGVARPRPSGLLELVFHELISLWATEIIRGAENVARQEGLTLVLSESAGREEMGLSWVDGVLTRDPAGVILIMSNLTADQSSLLVSRDVPFVVMDPAGSPADDVPSIGTTNWQGGYTATRHLLDLGHRRIGVIGGPVGVLCSRARIDGYRAALETAGVTPDSQLIRHGTFQHDAGYRIGRRLLTMADRPTALFTGNDIQAMGVYQAARELRLRIPEDISVIGFDDLPISAWMGPPLSTVRQPLVDMAEAAVRLVLELGRGGQPGMRRLELATSLVVRDSTAPPSA
ncbi:LacI family DNA-binding transcriptional regulator [Streptomyces sp. NBC_01190]|uniref:LacI family DNA-binding transcriptional regulator n=1 Tax=Streptomyces sp. NBC_01190 TaxID=2903767 RepID=UPI00386463A7|nr:LacI family DNA-binding transcriptional regulator [Streptomyces sp. NBC_01190]